MFSLDLSEPPKIDQSFPNRKHSSTYKNVAYQACLRINAYGKTAHSRFYEARGLFGIYLAPALLLLEQMCCGHFSTGNTFPLKPERCTGYNASMRALTTNTYIAETYVKAYFPAKTYMAHLYALQRKH